MRGLTSEELLAALRLARANDITRVVIDKDEAAKMTAADPTGTTWRAGDEYIEIKCAGV